MSSPREAREREPEDEGGRLQCVVCWNFRHAPRPRARRSREGLGDATVHAIRDGESLIELAREYDLGYEEMATANRHLDPFVPPRDDAEPCDRPERDDEPFEGLAGDGVTPGATSAPSTRRRRAGHGARR
jgi:hypothetical protein